MNKSILVAVLGSILILSVLSISFASALSFQELWGKITGKATIASLSKCNDTDGGINLYEKGVLIGYENETLFEQEDRCTEFLNGKILLEENYCYTDYEIGSGGILQIDCSKGCKDGKCLGSKKRIPSCYDSDKGENYNVRGYTKGPIFTGKEEDLIRAKIYRDSCTTKDGKNVLVEYFCRDGLVGSVSYSCSKGCSYARCK